MYGSTSCTDYRHIQKKIIKENTTTYFFIAMKEENSLYFEQHLRLKKKKPLTYVIQVSLKYFFDSPIVLPSHNVYKGENDFEKQRKK